MEQKYSVLLSLIRKSLWNSNDSIPNIIDWDEIYTEAVNQTVAGLVSHIIPQDNQQAWQTAKYATLAKFVRILNAQDMLFSLLNSNNIPFVILKGTSAAIYYPDPSVRTMGDIDVLVQQDKFVKTCQLLRDNGYIQLEDIKSYIPRHVGFEKDGIEIELHHHFSRIDLDIEDYLINGLDNLEVKTIENSAFPMLPRFENGLVLLDHMRNHMKSGLGLRHVIDWMLYVNKELHDDAWYSGFEKTLSTLGMKKFAIITTRTCQLYLGLPDTSITWCNTADEKICNELLQSILDSGNFGHKNGKGNQFETISVAMKREGHFRYLQRAGESNWKAYHKHHWLKPFAWFYQIFRYTKQSLVSKRHINRISDDLDRGKERYNLMKKMGID